MLWGVNRRTGRRWRQPTGGRIPLPKPKLSGRYLSVEERVQIADLHLTGTSMRMIAVEVGRSAGTISRELARGGSKTGPRGRTRYAPYAAQKQACLITVGLRDGRNGRNVVALEAPE